MAVEKFPDEISAIRKILYEHPEGLTIRSISAMLGMNRNSTAKYLDMIQMQGGVALKRSGPSKIYYLADKLPAAAVIKLTKNHVIIFDQALEAADINESFTDFLHISKTKILGKTLDLLPFALECHPALPALIKKGIQGGESTASASMKIGDRSFPCLLTVRPVFFEDGRNGVSLLIDLEQEHKNGEMPGNCEDDSLAELDVTEYVCRFAPDGTLTYVNSAYSDMLHKTKAELTGHTWRPTIPESEYKKIKKCLSSLSPAHPVALLELKAITPAGDFQWQRWKFRILSGQSGESEGFQGTGLDITEIKKLEQKISTAADERENLIQERKAEFQDLNKQIYNEIASHEKTHFQLQFTQFAMDKASYMITWIDHDGRFIYMNKEAQRELGYQYRDVILKKFPDIIAGVFSFPWDEIWETIKRDRQYTLETALRTSKGREIPVEMVLNFLEFKDKQYCCCFARDISQRKLTDEALKLSSKKYAELFELGGEAIFLIDNETGTLLEANAAASELYGYSRDALLTMKNSDLSAEKEETRTVTTTTPTGTIRVPLRYHRRKDGTVFPVEIIGRFFTWNERPVHIAAIRDITERKRVEDALRTSKTRLNTLVQTIPDLIWLKDADGIYLSCNPMFERFFGATEADIVGKTDYDFVDRELADFFREHDRKAMAAGKPTSNEEWITFADDGHRALLDTIKTPMFDDQGTLIGVLGIGHDITERKVAEETIQQSERHLRSVITTAPVALWDLDTAGTILLSEGNALARLGLKAGEIVGQSVFEFSKNDTMALALIRRGFQGEEFSAEVESGGRYWINHYVPRHDEKGNVLGLVGVSVDITERRDAEEALKMSEERYRSLFENMLEGFAYCRMLYDEDGRPADFIYLNVNPAFDRIFGTPVVVGKPVTEVFPGIKEAFPELFEIYGRVALTGEPESFDLDFTPSQKWIHVSVYSPEKGDFVAVFEDITGRKRAEMELRASEEKYRQLIELAQEGIWAIDADGKTLYVNPRMAEMLGYTAEEMLEEHLFSFMDDAGKTIAAEKMERRRQGIKEDHEFEFISKQGDRIYSALSTAPINDINGVYKGALAVVSDITERRQAEASLKESELKYRMLIENIPEKIFVKDASLAYVSCNEHYARDLGIAAEAVVHKTDFDFYPRDLAEKYRADDRAVLKSGYSRRIEERYVIQGTESWVSTLKTPIKDDAGNVSGLLGIFHDITTRKQREEDFRKKTFEQLQESYENLQKTKADLQIHQTELEVQNEELRRTQLSLEGSRERYFELYDLAPAGYLTLSGKGLILHANLTATTLLGVERHQLEEKPFTRYVVPDDQDIFYHCRKKLLETKKRQSCELRMMHAGASPFRVQIIAVPAPAGEGDEAAISLMVIDIAGPEPAGNGA